MRNQVWCAGIKAVRFDTANHEAKSMNADIHLSYGAIKATCSCGNVIETQSTLGKDILIDVCSRCHPFYTGKQKILGSGGRVDRFKKRFGNRRF